MSVISNKPAVDECNFNHFNTATIWDLVSFALWQALSAQDPCFANLLVDCVAARRPLNSALELDLDFERQIRPPPQATEEATASLEDLIKYAYQHCPVNQAWSDCSSHCFFKMTSAPCSVSVF